MNCFSYEAVTILQRQFHSAAIICIKCFISVIYNGYLYGRLNSIKGYIVQNSTPCFSPLSVSQNSELNTSFGIRAISVHGHPWEI